jgi:hypothetical protein
MDGLIDSNLKQWDGAHSTILEWKWLTKKEFFVLYPLLACRY